MLTPSPNSNYAEPKLSEVVKTPGLAPRLDGESQYEAAVEYCPDPRLIYSIAAAKRFGRKAAHDFNNILAVIHGFSGILQNRLRQDEANLGIVQQIEASALEALKLTDWLSTFASNRASELVLLDLNNVVEEWVTCIWKDKPAQIDLEMEFDPDSLPMLGDEFQLEGICRELWLNAVESMPQGGRVRWQTAMEKTRPPSPAEPENHGPVSLLRLSISDTGVGMDRETQESMFEPFFTTKAGKDRGLGLSTVYDTVHAHQGFIQVSSKPGAGTRVDVYFPAHLSESPEPHKSPSTQPVARQGCCKVLVVDDEEMILQMVGQMLEEQGCEVVGVVSGEAALDLYRQSREEIKAVVLDMTLPGISGLETFHKLKELNREVKVILSTGDPHQQAVRDAMAQGAFGVLSKPFLAGHLTEVVKQVLS